MVMGTPSKCLEKSTLGIFGMLLYARELINSTDLDALATISRSSAQLHPAPKKLRESSEIRRLRKLRDTFFHAEQLAPFYFVNLEI